MDVDDLVMQAFAEHGVSVQPATGHDGGGDFLLVDPYDAHIVIQVKHRSLVSADAATRLLHESAGREGHLLVVGDRVTEAARRVLTDARGGFLDLRGRLALRADRLWINVDVQPAAGRPARSEALSGKAGLEVATTLLLEPTRPVAVRELARNLGRSPSTVSEILAALRRDDIIDAQHVVAHTELFWRIAERWPHRRVHLARPPQPGESELLRLGLDDAGREPGWALTDSAAAAAFGAPVAQRSDRVVDFFVPDHAIARRAATLLGTPASTAHARATVRVAPVPAAVMQRIDLGTHQLEWPLTHPLFVALDLAQDIGRGREILDAWTPDSRWTRVW